MIRNSFQLTPNVLRTNTELFRYVFLSSPVTPIVPKRSPIFIEPLSVLPYGPRTLQSWPRQRLRPMINSGTWMPIMTPVHSGSNRLNRTRCIPFPLSCDTRLVQDSINCIQCISSILLPTNLIHSFRDIHPCDLVTRCAALWMQSHRVGHEVSFHYMDWQIPLLNQHSSTYPIG
jgi:hypothetical protein